MPNAKNSFNSAGKNLNNALKSVKLAYKTSYRFGWLFFLVTFLIISVATSSWFLFNQGDNPNNFKPVETNITELSKELEIEALVGGNNLDVTKNKSLLIKMPLFAGNQQDQNNYSQADYVITPWAIINNDLSLKIIQAKIVNNSQNSIASLVIPEKILNDLDFEQTIQLAYNINKSADSNYSGLNIQINFGKLTNRSKKMLLQLLGELKSQTTKTKTKLTLSTDLTILEDKMTDGIKANLDYLFVFCFQKDQCQAEVGTNASLIQAEKLITKDVLKAEGLGVVTDSYIQTIDPDLVKNYTTKE
jgi:hypothetical protein